MSITLSGTDRTIHTRMAAQSPAVDIASGTWRLGDTQPMYDDVALTTVPVGNGFSGSLDMTLVRPASSVGDSTVNVFARFVDADGANVMAGGGESGSAVVTTTETTVSFNIDPVPDGWPVRAAACEIGIQSLMTPPGDPVRVNRFPDPRATSVSNFYTRYSWGLTMTTMASAISGLTTCARVQTSSSDTGSGRGINLYESTDRSSPLGNAGYPVTGMAGQTITVSCYVYSTKAATYQLSARGYAGTTWKGSATTGSSVAVAAATWTRLSVTYTVASGATDMCVTAMTTNSVAWVSGDFIDMSGILFEDGATLNPYFDGTTVALITPPASSRWEGATNNSNSLLWAAAIPGGTTVQATDSVLTYSAEAEELIGAALERDLRRSVADIWSDAQALITAGTAGLLSGQLTFLCRSLAEALGLDAVYRMPGLVTLSAPPTLTEVRINRVLIPRATAAWGTFAGTGGAITTTTPADARWKGGTARRAVWTTAGTGLGYVSTGAAGTMAVGETWLIAMRVAVVGYAGALGLNVGGTNSPAVTYGPLSTIDHGDGTATLWRTVTCTSLGAGTGLFLIFAYLINGQVGHELWGGDGLAERGVSTFNGYFDGGYSPDPDLTPAWVGTPNASASTLTATTNINELDGLTHRAVGRARMNPERALPGKSLRWLLVVDFREQVT